MPRRNEIWARGLWAAIDMAQAAHLDCSSLFQDLPFDGASVRKLKRVAWDDFATVCERIQDLAGGPEELARLTEANLPHAMPEVQALAASVVSPKTLLRLNFTVIAPLVYPGIDFVFSDRGPDLAHLEIWLPESFRPSIAVQWGTLGMVRSYPRFLGLPPAIVTGETHGDHVSWDVELPASRTLVARAKRASSDIRVLLGYEDTGEPVSLSWGIEAEGTRLEMFAKRNGLTPRQTEVLDLVTAGKSNKEIASELGTAVNTVELHMTNLLRRSGVQSRAELISQFWSSAS